MEPTIVAAIIALIGTLCLGGVTLIGALLTLFIGLRGLKVEREKLTADMTKMRVELDESRQKRIAEETANIEIEKQKGIALSENRKNIYAEMLELVYRLRNQLRSVVQQPDELNSFFRPNQLGEELYLLTENLYKYRAYIDEETFQLLHQYKRLLQDAQVLINRMTRPPEVKGDEPIDWIERDELYKESVRKAYQESEVEIKKIYQEVENIYIETTRRIQSHIESVLMRK